MNSNGNVARIGNNTILKPKVYTTSGILLVIVLNTVALTGNYTGDVQR